MSAIPKKKYTLEEYFELENSSEARFEYFNGEVFEMSGASPNHVRLQHRAGLLFGNQLDARGCSVFLSDLRVVVPALPPYRYADLTALCSTPVFEEINGLDCLTNPTLIVEILSPSTEAFDRGDKFSGYKSIPSFCEYLLIAQDKKLVTKYVKQSKKFWLQSEYVKGEILQVESLDCELKIDELYQGISFESATTVS
jgi:Uma2 family endonuclease